MINSVIVLSVRIQNTLSRIVEVLIIISSSIPFEWLIIPDKNKMIIMGNDFM
jgi:hypothetical protein